MKAGLRYSLNKFPISHDNPTTFYDGAISGSYYDRLSQGLDSIDIAFVDQGYAGDRPTG